MCGRFAQARDAGQFFKRFVPDRVAPLLPNPPPRYNVAPTQDALVLRRNPKTELTELGTLRWGLVPNWAGDVGIAARTINARSETVAATAAFKDAWRAARRCVIPVDAFYEWKPGSHPKQPYAIARRDRAPLALAGLWDGWKDPATGDWLRTFTILTCEPNSFMASLHDRMPVILPDDGIQPWLAAADGTEAMTPYAGDDLEMWPVSTRLNSTRQDGPDLLEPVPEPLSLDLG